MLYECNTGLVMHRLDDCCRACPLDSGSNGCVAYRGYSRFA